MIAPHIESHAYSDLFYGIAPDEIPDLSRFFQRQFQEFQNPTDLSLMSSALIEPLQQTFNGVRRIIEGVGGQLVMCELAILRDQFGTSQPEPFAFTSFLEFCGQDAQPMYEAYRSAMSDMGRSDSSATPVEPIVTHAELYDRTKSYFSGALSDDWRSERTPAGDSFLPWNRRLFAYCLPFQKSLENRTRGEDQISKFLGFLRQRTIENELGPVYKVA